MAAKKDSGADIGRPEIDVPPGTVLYDSGDGVRKLAGWVMPNGEEAPTELKVTAGIFGRCGDVAKDMLEHGAALRVDGNTALGDWWDACGRIANTVARMRVHASTPEYAHELARAAQRIVAKMEEDLAREGLSPDFFRNVPAPASFSERDEEFYSAMVARCGALQEAMEDGEAFRSELSEAALRLSQSVTTLYRGLCPVLAEGTISNVRETLEAFEAFDDAERIARAVMRAAKVDPNRIKAFRNAKSVATTRQKPSG